MHDEGGSLAAETAKALCEELERERRQRLEDVRRERKERLEAQRRANQMEVEMGEAHRRAELLEAALWEAQREARRLREELEAERSKGFWRTLFGGRGFGILVASALRAIKSSLPKRWPSWPQIRHEAPFNNP
jgi:hypothetical protein